MITLPTSAASEKAVRMVVCGWETETMGASHLAAPIPTPARKKGIAQQAARPNDAAMPLVTSATAPVLFTSSFMVAA